MVSLHTMHVSGVFIKKKSAMTDEKVGFEVLQVFYAVPKLLFHVNWGVVSLFCCKRWHGLLLKFC